MFAVKTLTVYTLIHLFSNCAQIYYGWFLLKWSTVCVGLNGIVRIFGLQIFRAKTICSFCPIQPLVVVCFVCLFLPWSKHSPKCFSILNCHPSSMTSQPLISIVISTDKENQIINNGNRKKISRFIVAFITLVLDISEKGWHSPICLLLFFLFVCFFFLSRYM